MSRLIKAIACLALLSLNPSITEAKDENPYDFVEPLYIEVYLKSCQLIVYKELGDKLERVCALPVATVRPGTKLYPRGGGRIFDVQLKPIWAPTPSIVEYMNKKSQAAGRGDILKKGEIIKPGDQRNAMGSFKMLLTHSQPGKGQIYRIHGTNMPDSIGKRVSSGCIRMDNVEGYVLALNIKARLKKHEIVKVDILEL